MPFETKLWKYFNKQNKFIDSNKEESSQEFNEKWSAHLFYVDRKKCIVFAHKETLYSFVVPNLKKTNPNTLSEQITEELKKPTLFGQYKYQLCIQLFRIDKSSKYLFS